MSRIKLVLLIAAGFILPVALAFTAYLISSGFDASANVVSVPAQRIAPATASSSEPADERGKDSSNKGDDGSSVSPTAAPAISPTDDHGGDSPNSGPGSDSSGHDGGDDSGSGSDRSGHGGGDD
jgi:hypothetical protein